MNGFISTVVSLIAVISISSFSHAEIRSDKAVWPGSILSAGLKDSTKSSPSMELVKQSYFTKLGINKSIMETPLRIFDTNYSRGLGTYATSEIIVRLDKPARKFHAEIGIDNNFQTNKKLGSSIFIIEASGKELYRSKIITGSDAPAAIDIDLDDVKEFKLIVTDAGDGPEYDEADWADSYIVLNDGKKVWLDELPVISPAVEIIDSMPFSFTYDKKPISRIIENWNISFSSKRLLGGRSMQTVRFYDPETGLEIVCEITRFNDFPAVDWVVYLTNNGSSDTPLIEDLRAADMQIVAANGSNSILRHLHGSTAQDKDFLPINEKLSPEDEIHLAPVDGRSSDTAFPFFNIDCDGSGLIGAIGWSGQWSFDISRDQGNVISLKAGQETTRFILHPGETIRTPRMLLLAWRGNDLRDAHNQFRKLMADHYLVKNNDKLFDPPITQNTWFYVTPNGANEKNQLDLIDFASELGVEYYWLDAGWFEGGWSMGAGSWVPKKDAFPNGLKPLSDAAHKKGMKFVLWFEPERVCHDTIIAKEHPEWVMHVRPGDEKPSIQPLDENMLFRLGDPDARKWLTDILSKCITDWGVDIYRQDFNIFGTKYFWIADDAPDRQGISENMYVQGLYAMWDELLARHPNLVIDNCASGGRRIDLELLSRSVILWRSDSQCVGKPMPIQDQVQTAGLSMYVPLHSASVWTFDPYEWRSVVTTGTNLCMDYRVDDFDKTAARQMIEEAKLLRPFWRGDYYPLTEINSDPTQWIAWQFHRDDLNSGFAMYFRRPECRYIAVEAALRGIDMNSMYEVSMPDIGYAKKMTGEELKKLPVMIKNIPGSMLLIYKKADK